MGTHNNINMPDYLRSRTNKTADKRANKILTNKYIMNSVIFFPDVGCFEGKFSMQVKEGSHLYEGPPT